MCIRDRPGESLAQAERRLVAGFDSVSICLSKGLGAPVGSVLLGSQSLIADARRWRKMLGGGMRQAGVLAAAGLYALEHNVARLADDHANARLLAELLAGVPGLRVDLGPTNMLFLQIAPEQADGFMAHLQAQQVLASGRYTLRLVTHLDVSEADVRRVAQTIRTFF